MGQFSIALQHLGMGKWVLAVSWEPALLSLQVNKILLCFLMSIKQLCNEIFCSCFLYIDGS